MCPTCNCGTSSIPGPGEVAGGALGLAVGAAISKPGRRVLFWGLAVPLLPFAVVGVFGWWTIALVAGAALLSAAGLAYARFLHRLTVGARPEPTHEMRAALTARGLRPIPAPMRAARPALPRAVVRQLARGRLSLPAVKVPAPRPAHELPAAQQAIEPTRVLPARPGAAGQQRAR